MSDAKWIKRWGYELSPTPRPGVWKRRDGGYILRARVKNPRTGKLVEVRRVSNAKGPADAAAELARALEVVRSGNQSRGPSAIRWHEYIAQWTERTIHSGNVKSCMGRRVLAVEAVSLVTKGLASLYVDQMRPADFLAWRAELAALVAGGELSATTANRRLALLQRIVKAAVVELELPRDPTVALQRWDTSLVRTYTREQPNSIRVTDLQVFCDAIRQVTPHLHAAVVLGFATGLRPSSLRPLRHQGPEADVQWDTGTLLVRRSWVEGEIMDCTKTGEDIEIALPPEAIELLRAHLAQRPAELQSCELLFPRLNGQLLGRNDFGEAYKKARVLLGWTDRWLTPRSMRRTFQDTTRAAQVRDLVTRSISGHSSATMQQRYSTVSQEEQRAAVAAALRPLMAIDGGVGAASQTPGDGGSGGGIDGGLATSERRFQKAG